MRDYSDLAHLLANLFYKQDDFIRIVIAAGYNPAVLQITYSAINNWALLLHDAQKDGKLKDILAVALEQKPDNEYLRRVYDSLSGNMHGKAADNMQIPSPRRDIHWKSGNKTIYKEALTMNYDSLKPIYFLELGTSKSRNVVLVKTPGPIGTGFIVAGNYLITNNHIIASEVAAAEATIIFNYERRLNKQYKKLINVKLDPSKGFATNEDTDWTIVKLKTNPLKPGSYLTFAKHPIQKNEFVNIIQHPAGDEKKIGIYHNIVTYAKDGIVQYLTDTEEGSSGAPVFNADWEVVALHHGSTRVAGAVDGDELRNEGSDIQVVRKQIQEAIPGIEL